MRSGSRNGVSLIQLILSAVIGNERKPAYTYHGIPRDNVQPPMPRPAKASSASTNMITGIETAGLVLAVLPLLIQALSAYNNGLEKTGIILGVKQKRYKLKVKRLRLRLEGQSMSLHVNLAKLIGRAAPAEDITRLPEKYDDILWTGATAEKVKAYLQLGGTFEIFKDTLSMYQSYLEEIAGELVGVLWPPKADKKDLKALLNANKLEDGRYQYWHRLSFVMNEARIGELLRDMDDSVSTIKGFIDDNEDLHQIQRSHKEPREAKRKKITNSFYMIRKQANVLFRAILCGWSHECHERHHAMLCLEDRCQDDEDKRKESPRGLGTVKFRLFFSKQHMASPESSSWQESSIVTVEEDSCTLLNRNVFTAHTKSVTFKTTPDIVVTSTETAVMEASAPIEIKSICKSLTEASPPIFQLSTDNRLFWCAKKSTNAPRLAEEEQRAMSLEAFLRDHRHIDPDDRIKLAVNLASSLLQYNLTPWLKKCWTKDTIYFLTQARSISGVDVEHPLILKQFHNQDSTAPYEPPENDPELALMELGILLLEIWNMKTFETWLETMGHSIDSSQLHDADVRLKYSIKWFKCVKTKLLPNYCEVVGICLRPAAFDLFDTSWEDAEFRVTVYKKIVEPLLIWGS